jgi:hypothetical protein
VSSIFYWNEKKSYIYRFIHLTSWYYRICCLLTK